MTTQLRQQRKQLGGRNRVYQNIVSTQSKEPSCIYDIQRLTNAAQHHPPELKVDLGIFTEERSSDQRKYSH
jgi:hypothetical protein